MRFMLKLGLAGLLVFSLAAQPKNPASLPMKEPVALEQWFADDTLWQLSPQRFMAGPRANRFVWMSAGSNLARSVATDLTFCGLPVIEAAAKFESDQLRSLSLSLYNRGDAGDRSKAEFVGLIAKVEEQLNQWVGARGSAPRESTAANHAVVRRQAWRKGPHRLDLACAFTLPHGTGATAVEYRSEYVRLDLSPVSASSDPNLLFGKPALTPMRTLTTADLWTRVKRQPNGDVALAGVPMVDQGEKGYCAVAVAERLMRYYGREVDQHEFAQMANTGSRGGTSARGMLDALQELGGKLGLDVMVLQEFSYSDFRMLMSDYNALARQARQSEIIYGQRIDLVEIYKEMDLLLLRQARRKRDGARTEFKAAVTKHVNAGVPLAWNVMTGKVNEQPSIKGTGAHMRLIIGYNDRTNEILYTDSWGPGHELKRMPLDDAWAVSLALYRVTPRNLRL